MTCPMTLAVLSRAGAVSKPHDYKQNVQKMKGLLKEWALTRNSLKISDKKFQKFHSTHGEQNKRTTRPQGQKLNMNLVARKKETEAKSKKAFRSKLMELYQTRTKKSTPDLFNFYVISGGHDTVIDTDKATTCSRQFKAPWLQTERTKNEGPSEKMSFDGEKFENFKPNKKLQSSHSEQNKGTKRPQRQKLNMKHVARRNKLRQNWKKHSD